MVEETEEQQPSTANPSLSEGPNTTPTQTTTLERVRSQKRKAQELIAEICRSTNLPVEIEQNKRRRKSETYMSGYKKRVATFKGLKWIAIPEISPREFAEYGWVMKGPELVECVACTKIISTVLPDIKECLVSTYVACVKNIHEKLVSAHENICVFRSPSADYFQEFRNSIENLKDFYKRTFGQLKEMYFGKYRYDDPDLKSLITSVFGELSDDDFVAAAFAITQWTPTEDTKKVECELCARVCMPSILPSNTSPASQHYNWCPLLDFATDGTTLMWKELASYFKRFEKKKPLADAFHVRTKLSHTISSSLINE